MNDIAKQATTAKFLSALKKEHLSKKDAGECIGLAPAQVSCLFNKHFWGRLGNVPWDKVLKWVNSGQGLQEYGKKQGKVVSVDMARVDTARTSPDDIINAEKAKTVDDVMDNVAKSAERHLRRAEKKNKEPLFSVRLAEIGWIQGLAKNGKTAEQISKELNVYIEIVKAIIEQKPKPEDTSKSHDLRIIALLIQEKSELREKMDAINNLLAIYNIESD